MSSFINKRLEFTKNTIIENGTGREVMMDWERELMKRHAQVVCQNRGAILEIGFGMGISANYIQQHAIESHTIVECHPQVVPKLIKWAEDKRSVRVIAGEWDKVKEEFGKYDGVFYDAFNDDAFLTLPATISKIMNPGGIFTFFNNYEHPRSNWFALDATYETIAVNPPPNHYFNRTTYYLPTVRY